MTSFTRPIGIGMCDENEICRVIIVHGRCWLSGGEKSVNCDSLIIVIQFVWAKLNLEVLCYDTWCTFLSHVVFCVILAVFFRHLSNALLGRNRHALKFSYAGFHFIVMHVSRFCQGFLSQLDHTIYLLHKIIGWSENITTCLSSSSVVCSMSFVVLVFCITWKAVPADHWVNWWSFHSIEDLV